MLKLIEKFSKWLNKEEVVEKFDYDKEVKELREKGWKIFIRHARKFKTLGIYQLPNLLTRAEFEKLKDEKNKELEDNIGWNLFPIYKYETEVCTKGGVTSVRLVSPEGTEYAGHATCSENDNFCRKTGRELAMKRALQKVK